mmetsp:Transcript_10722/g.19919  ORF Transcript_10722/g.19919 Transcript_10722/m.19919 type:complete len:240 (+) Transcript_10722:1639-2358(+)
MPGACFASCTILFKVASAGALTSTTSQGLSPLRKNIASSCDLCILSVRPRMATPAAKGRLVPRLANASANAGFSGFTRINFAAGKRLMRSSSSLRTVGTVRPQPISTQTSRNFSFPGLLSNLFSQASYFATCIFRRSLEKAVSRPNICTAGRATLPHFGHAGRKPLTRCVSGSSSKFRSLGACQTSGQQGSEHCSHLTAPCTSTIRSSSKPEDAQWLSMLDVKEKPPNGAARIHSLTRS